MSRRSLTAVAVGLLVGLWGVAGAAPRDRVEPPAVSLLKIPAASRQKPPVRFSHRLHEEKKVACTQCHHEYRGRRNVWRQGQPVKPCGDCHGVAPEAHPYELKTAFHLQCRGCHLKLRREGRRAGPTDCRQCHRPS